MKKHSTIVILSNGVKLELGPHLQKELFLPYTKTKLESKTYKNSTQMIWNDIRATLEQLNKALPENEGPWRMITKEEYEEIGKPIRDIMDNQDIDLKERKKMINKQRKDLGFTKMNYWSGTRDMNTPGFYWDWSSFNGCVGSVKGDGFLFSVRCAREIR